jgi:hypothetical protein
LVLIMMYLAPDVEDDFDDVDILGRPSGDTDLI